MASDPRLAALPALRKRAEEEARSCHDAQVAAIKAKHHGHYAQDLIDALPPAWVDVDTHLTLLSDLSRPASRDAVARLVAEALGLECGATAPVLVRIKGVDPSTIWSLSVRSDVDMDRIPSVTVDQRGFVEPGAFPDSTIATAVPGISAVTDRTEALALIAVSVLGGAS